MIFCNEYGGNFATRNHWFFGASNEEISQRVTSAFLQRATTEFQRETSNEWKVTPPLWRCLKNVIHQIDSKNKWLLISVIFMAKLELVFVLTFKNSRIGMFLCGICFKRFQYFDFEIYFLENENLFQKTGVQFLSGNH